MQRSIVAAFARITINKHSILSIYKTFNCTFIRSNSTIASILNEIDELPIYNINKLSTRNIDSWDKLSFKILDITSNINSKKIVNKNNEELLTDKTEAQGNEVEDIQSASEQKHADLSSPKESVILHHLDYLRILDKLCDRGFNNQKFFLQYISNLQSKFENIRKPALLTKFLHVLCRSNTKFKPVINLCTKSLDHEMESRIGEIFLDKEYIQHFINNLLRYIHTTDHFDVRLLDAIFEIVIDGYKYICSSTLINILYNMSMCFKDYNKTFDIMSYQEHDFNTPKQHFLTPIARYLHKNELSCMDKAKLYRTYVLFGFDHITFSSNLLKEVIEQAKQGVDFEDFDHFSHNYQFGFTVSRDKFTRGQMLMIADTLLMSRNHHFSKYYKELVQSVYFNCVEIKQIPFFDPIELKCALTVIANSQKHILPDQEILCELTKRMIEYFECNRINSADFSVFLKDLVRCTRVKIVKKNQRNRTIRITKFTRMDWINKSKDDEKSLLERISVHLTPKTDIVHLCLCLRCIAYLGFNNKQYYAQFIDHFKANAGKLPTKSIAHLEQTFNKVKLTDKHLFYLLGKQFQELHHASTRPNDKILLRRIG